MNDLARPKLPDAALKYMKAGRSTSTRMVIRPMRLAHIAMVMARARIPQVSRVRW